MDHTLFEAQMAFVDAGLAVIESLKKKKKTDMQKQLTGVMVAIKLPKPYTLTSPDTTVHSETVFGESMYFRTGTILTFDSGFWIMPEMFISSNLNEGIEVHYDIPGKKEHSRHTTGYFIATVHCIANLSYHADVYTRLAR